MFWKTFILLATIWTLMVFLWFFYIVQEHTDSFCFILLQEGLDTFDEPFYILIIKKANKKNV